MLKSELIHPHISAALAGAGHGAKVLIADGNYPLSTRSGPNADLVYLNLRPGLPTVTDVLETILTEIPVEAAEVMAPPDHEPEIFAEFRKLLPGIELQHRDRFAFYEAAESPEVCLAIATGEERVYANILLTIGVVKP
ncbi:MAG TPA: RbsD/FucU family protein [bacterium]|nr:RbsD/FucU family protein [bacterium]HQO35913.1 RbsD/FucU family protein [bacterium]HQP99471.1 RbsD/FucU family protein [bacterium]